MKKQLEEIFRENLKFYRKQKKLSQEKLSVAIDKNIFYINMIESGKSLPPINTVGKIAEVLKIRPSLLFEPLENLENTVKTQEKIDNAIAQLGESAKAILGEYFL